MADYSIGKTGFSAAPLPGGLYVVATPIGNLGDVTLRALETLAAVDAIACEDSRISSKLLNRYGIDRRLIPYHEHNAAKVEPKLRSMLQEGKSIALISDAGTPLISDPGYRLVQSCRRNGIAVYAIPGASAAIAALSASGFATDSFFFAGFLPARHAARVSRLKQLAAIPATLIFYESPKRLSASLHDLSQVLGADRKGAICRELTKLHEEQVSGPLGELADRYQGESVKGEIVLLVEPPGDETELDIDRLLADLLAEHSVSRAAAEAAAISGLPKREIYRRALQLSQQDDSD